MLEPQSTLLFAALIVAFGGLAWWLAAARTVAVKAIAGCLAFAVAMTVGVLAVNRYYGYYATWGAAAADFGNQNPAMGPRAAQSALLAGQHANVAGSPPVYVQLARQQGYTLRLTVTGTRSHITRTVYVYLPPQYFEPQFARYRFPVIELIHGQPGEPQDWINVVGIQVTLDSLIARGRAAPAVLIMPDANGGRQVSLQCLNQANGPQDLTYLALDVPDAISRLLRVQPPGAGWGVAGYSEGGFCAANMALRYRWRYGFAASMSGYFAPLRNVLASPTRWVSPFGGNPVLKEENTPITEVRALAPGARLPSFWLGAGLLDQADVRNAEYFAQELEFREAQVPLDLTPGGAHNMVTWQAEVPPMLTWMTQCLASTVPSQHRA